MTVARRTAPPGYDLEGLVRPLLEALARIANLDATYLAVFDWDTREQEVRFLHTTAEVGITDRSRLPLPVAMSRESLPGVTRSPEGETHAHPDSQLAKHVGLATYVSVPIVLAGHELWGMVCGASRPAQAEVSDRVITVMEAFADIIAEQVSWERAAATERRAEAAEAELRLRGRFLAQAEHQLKTPLTVLRGAVELLQRRWDGLSDEERREWFAMTSRSADALSADIDGLLEEALADLRRRDLVPADVDVAAVVGPMIRAFDALSDRHEVRLEVEERLRAWVDPTALSQVLGHLLDNAVKFSPDGGLVLVAGRSTPGGVEISVVDEGLGLPEGIDIFQAFQRGEHDHVSGPGVGLGLHIVRGLVEASGGSVTATPNSVAGSTFAVRLPSRSLGAASGRTNDLQGYP